MRRGEDGFAGGLEALAFGVLVFVAGTLLALAAWNVVDAKQAVGAAAREATRLVVESAGTTTPSALEAAAEARADEVLTGHGRDASVSTVRLATDGRPLGRCVPVTTRVTTRVDMVRLPFVGTFLDGGLTVGAAHTERVDPWRSGLPGEADCG